ncbi:MAG TPA: hypothetical protein V6D15_00050 [Oculatellaceae cyanobacterium]|jgi:hypothetical protein
MNKYSSLAGCSINSIELNKIPLKHLMLLASMSLFLDMLVANRFESLLGFGLAVLGNFCLLKQQEATRLFNLIQNWGRKYRINIATLLFCVVGTVYFLNYMAFPSSAQFFNQTQSWLESSFPLSANGQSPNGDVNIYALVFNSSGGDKRPQSLMCFAHQGSALIKKLSAY